MSPCIPDGGGTNREGRIGERIVRRDLAARGRPNRPRTVGKRVDRQHGQPRMDNGGSGHSSVDTCVQTDRRFGLLCTPFEAPPTERPQRVSMIIRCSTATVCTESTCRAA